MSAADSLKREIFEKIAEFYSLEHGEQPFILGQTKIHYAGRVYDEREMMAMVDAVLEFWLTMGRYAETFEEELGKFLGVSEVVFVNSGSSANLLAVATLCSKELEGHLEQGDEVITPAVTFPTTVAPLIQNGLIPVFVDCELGTYNLDVSALEEAISERTKAIFAPHTLGNPCEMDRIMRLAEKWGLFVIEDACDALGSRFDGGHVGTFGHLGTLSFYPAHHITTGEGGAVVTNDKKLAKIARSIRDWGRACWCEYNTTDPNGACGRRFEWKIPGLPDTYDHRYLYTNIGYNLRPTDIQAALGVVQLAKLPGFIEKRKHNFQRLFEGLKRHEDHLILPRWSERADVSWFAFPITVRPEAPFIRQELVCWLEGARIETRLLFAGNIINQPGYRDMKCRLVGKLENSDLVMRNSFFIGVYPGLDDVRIDYVLDKFEEFFSKPPLSPPQPFDLALGRLWEGKQGSGD
ncbi:MAG: lipopolysaccharide biosynthesis protein RfbH [Anaerolineales bacterium]|nr:lipopolysaccharide biosynthesis protein RfbH [Anaerolineales bacterium]